MPLSWQVSPAVGSGDGAVDTDSMEVEGSAIPAPPPADDEEAAIYRSLALELDLGDAVEAADAHASSARAPGAVQFAMSKAATPSSARFMDAGGVGALADAIQPVAADEMAPLLDDLRVEPDNDEERAAKFEIYEAGHETVQKSREALFDFWGECSREFAEYPQAMEAVERDIKLMDKEENLGIVDIEGVGCVFFASIHLLVAAKWVGWWVCAALGGDCHHYHNRTQNIVAHITLSFTLRTHW